MRKETRTKIIPEQSVTQEIFIANDGTEFYREKDCEAYEKRLAIESHHVFKTCVTGCFTFDECYGVVLYNLRNDEDHEFLRSTFTDRQLIHLDDEYKEYGPGWYMYYTESGDYMYDTSHLKNVRQYINETRDALEEWEAELTVKMTVSSLSS